MSGLDVSGVDVDQFIRLLGESGWNTSVSDERRSIWRPAHDETLSVFVPHGERLSDWGGLVEEAVSRFAEWSAVDPAMVVAECGPAVFQQRPKRVKAMRVTADNVGLVCSSFPGCYATSELKIGLVGGWIRPDTGATSFTHEDEESALILIVTSDCTFLAWEGDFVVEHPNGAVLPEKADRFEAIYEGAR